MDALKQLIEKLKAEIGQAEEALASYEGAEKTPYKAYRSLRKVFQDVKRDAQAFRVALLTNFKEKLSK